MLKDNTVILFINIRLRNYDVRHGVFAPGNIAPGDVVAFYGGDGNQLIILKQHKCAKSQRNLRLSRGI